MFTLKNLLHVFEKENLGWKNPTEMTKSILLAIADYPYPSDMASKIYSGVNQGRNIRLDIETVISEQGFDSYINDVEKRLKNQNFRNRNFTVSLVVESVYQLLKASTDLTQDIYRGLVQSYTQNKDNRPYLFLGECLYYSLELAHNKQTAYRDLAILSNQPHKVGLEAWGEYLDEALLEEELTPQFLSVASKMTKKEIDIFLQLAELAIYDEDEAYYLYAPVSDQEIDLYRQFGMDNREFLLMEEFGIVNLGARMDNIVEVNDEPAGFQNDNLVFYFTTDQEALEIHYKSYNFTSVGLKLLDILAIETSDEFFKQLTTIIADQYQHLPIEFFLEEIDYEEE